MTANQMIIGPLAKAVGTEAPLTGSRDSSQRVQDTHGRYQEAVYNGSVFVASNQALATLQTGLTTIQTGLGLYNPIGSGKNLVILYASCGFTVAYTAASVIGLCAATTVTQAAPTSQTVATYRNSLLGYNGAPVGIPLVAGTLAAAPVFASLLGIALTGLITTDTQNNPFEREFAGSLIVAPGAYLGFFSSTASPAGFWGELAWEEIAI